MVSLVLEGVNKKIGQTQVLSDVNIKIQSGEFIVIVGPSGCGKTSLLRMIAGLEDVTSGRIEIDSVDVTKLEPGQREIAMVFQNYALYPHMTVRQNLGFSLKMAGNPKKEIADKVNFIAEKLGLDDLMGRKPSQLSGGQSQRVAIGRALVRTPKVFLFDEPLSSLDAKLRMDMRLEIANLHKEMCMTIIYVTHDQVEAMTLADRIVVLCNGKIEQIGTPLEIFDNPNSLFVASYIGSPQINLIKAKIVASKGGSFTVLLWGSKRISLNIFSNSLEVGADVVLGIRPEHIVHDQGKGDICITVDHIEHLGGVSYIYCFLPDGQKVTIESKQARDISEGDVFSIAILREYILLFSINGKRYR